MGRKTLAAIAGSVIVAVGGVVGWPLLFTRDAPYLSEPTSELGEMTYRDDQSAVGAIGMVVLRN